MAHLILATIAGTVLGDALLVAWLAYRASLAPKIQPPSPSAKADVFHIHRIQMLASRDGRAWPMECWCVDAESPAEAIEGLLLAAHEVGS